MAVHAPTLDMGRHALYACRSLYPCSCLQGVRAHVSGAGAQRAEVPKQAARHVPAGSSRLQPPGSPAVAGAGTQPGARVPAGRSSPSPVAGPNPSSTARALGDVMAAGGGGGGGGAAAMAEKEVNLRELVARAVRTHTKPCAHAGRRMMHALFCGAGGHPQWPCMSPPCMGRHELYACRSLYPLLCLQGVRAGMSRPRVDMRAQLCPRRTLT